MGSGNDVNNIPHIRKGAKSIEEVAENNTSNSIKTGPGLLDRVFTPKRTIDCMSATSIRELVKRVNEYNAYYSETPILKKDIVSILQGGEGYILLYYK